MKEINGKMFKQMVLSGAIVLHNNHPEVDALNVFPVPDGDTGTNMYHQQAFQPVQPQN